MGDVVIYPDGHEERISRDWGYRVQTSTDGSFYVGDHGYVNFSGNLNPSVAKDLLLSHERDLGHGKTILIFSSQ